MSTTENTQSDEGSQYFEQSVEVSLLHNEPSVVAAADDENKHDSHAVHTAAPEPPKARPQQLRKRKAPKPAADEMQGYDYCAPQPHMHDGMPMQQQPPPVFLRMPSVAPDSGDDKCCRWKWVSRGGLTALVVLALVFFALGVSLLAQTREDVVTSTDTMGSYSKDLSTRRPQYIAAMDGMVDLISAATGKTDEASGGVGNTTFADQLRNARTEIVGVVDEIKTVVEAVSRVSTALKDAELESVISNAAETFRILASIAKKIEDTGRVHIILQT